MSTELEQQSIQKYEYFWSFPQILLASILSGPMAGFYILGRNFRRLGFSKYANRCYVGGLVLTIILLLGLFLLPEQFVDRLPKSFLSIITMCFVLTVASSQKEETKEKLRSGARRYSYWWWVLLVTSLTVIQVALIVLSGIFLAVVFS